ncbi:MAG: putative quinol monooxygenase [Candidatus Hinthialibacter antarcticus]|nr:putative quinol monooxygenase [Candidatus Hinthialibacter antarcticus]
MFVVVVEFESKAGCEAPLLDAVKTQAKNSIEREVECLQFDVCIEPDHPNKIFLYEVYANESAFQAHTKTNHFAAFDQTVQPWIESKTVRILSRIQNGENG